MQYANAKYLHGDGGMERVDGDYDEKAWNPILYIH